MKTDTELLDAFGEMEGCNLISDDGGRWAVSTSGFQPMPLSGGFTESVHIVSFVDPHEWRPSIREALEYFFAQQQDDATDQPRGHREARGKNGQG